MDPYTGTLQEEPGKLLDSAHLPYSVELAMRRLGMIIEVPLDDGEEIHQIEMINPKLTSHCLSLLEVIGFIATTLMLTLKLTLLTPYSAVEW